MHRRGRRQRPRAARLRRCPLRRGHDRLHDAELPLAGDRALRPRGHDAAARRRLGARGLGAVAQRGRRSGRCFPETDPHWQWTDGLRHLVDCVETGRSRPTRPEHAYHALEIMLAAQAAGARRESRARSRPASPTRSSATPLLARRGCASLARPPQPRWAISPRLDRRSTARRRIRVGRRRRATRGATRRPASSTTGSTSRRDLIHAIVFGLPTGRRVPPLGELPHGLRRRRGAARAAGHARAREPRDRRGRSRRAGRERLLPPRHLAPRLLVRRRAAAGARVLRAAPVHRHVRAVRADEGLPARGALVLRRRRNCGSFPRRCIGERNDACGPPARSVPPARRRRARGAHRRAPSS